MRVESIENSGERIRNTSTSKQGFIFSLLATHPVLLEVGGEVLALGGHGDVVVLALLLREQLEPAVLRGLDHLRDAEGHRAHEVVPRGAVPVPDLDQQTAVLVVRLEIAVGKENGSVFGFAD